MLINTRNYSQDKILFPGEHGSASVVVDQHGRKYVLKTTAVSQLNTMKYYKCDDQNAARLFEQLQTDKHPNLLRLYQIQRSANFQYILTEYCSEGSLQEYIQNLNDQNVKLTPTQQMSLIQQLFLGYNDLKKHNDLQIKNIFINKANGDLQLKIGEFPELKNPQAALNRQCFKPESQNEMFQLGEILFFITNQKKLNKNFKTNQNKLQKAINRILDLNAETAPSFVQVIGDPVFGLMNTTRLVNVPGMRLYFGENGLANGSIKLTDQNGQEVGQEVNLGVDLKTNEDKSEKQTKIEAEKGDKAKQQVEITSFKTKSERKTVDLEQSVKAWEDFDNTEKEKIEIKSPLTLTKRLQIMKEQAEADSETFSENYGANIGSGKIIDLVPSNSITNRDNEKHTYSESTRETKRKVNKK